MNESLLLDLYKNQSHLNSLLDKTSSLFVTNASCGDDINLGLEIDAGVITKASFSGAACSITLASAEYLCRSLEGKKISDIDVEKLKQECLVSFDMLKKERRVLCALLPYQALESLKNQKEEI